MLCTESWILCLYYLYRNHRFNRRSIYVARRLRDIPCVPWQILTPLYFEGSRASRATAGRSYSHQWTSGPLCQPTLMPPHFADGQNWPESLKASGVFQCFSLTLQRNIEKLSDADPLEAFGGNLTGSCGAAPWKDSPSSSPDDCQGPSLASR